MTGPTVLEVMIPPQETQYFPLSPPKKQYAALLFMDVELTTAPPSFLHPLHSTSIRLLICSSFQPGSRQLVCLPEALVKRPYIFCSVHRLVSPV